MAFGKIKADAIIRDNSGTEEEVTLASLVAKAGLASPTFTGTPEAPTANAGTNTTQVATTAFVTTAANARASTAANNFTAAQQVTVSSQTSAGALDMDASNFIEVAGVSYNTDPTGLNIGTSGVFIATSAAPTDWHADFKHPAATYTAPTAFPAVAPWYVNAANSILVGSWTQCGT
jgi:hypothetical protein